HPSYEENGEMYEKKLAENSLRYSYVPFFQNTQLKLNKLLEFSYYWLAGIISKQIAIITGCSNKTTTKQTKNLPRIRRLEAGPCTNTTEGTWYTLKYKISPRNRKNSLNEDNLLNNILWEFILRRIHENDLWNGFIRALRNMRIAL
ncbi:hypothetical protein HZS_8067, partial [Henneguya salminicola]